MIPDPCQSWILWQENSLDSQWPSCRSRIEQDICQLARRKVALLNGPKVDDDSESLIPYSRRIWECIWFHWQQMGEAVPMRFIDMLEKMESGELSRFRVQRDILFEVVLAQAMELGESTAVTLFEADYMPAVRAVARRMGGVNAVDAVDNFAAELVLPRGDKPPRIARFAGRTSFSGWLRAVVSNYCVSIQRLRKSRQEVLSWDIPSGACLRENADRQPCENLLKPMFFDAVQRTPSEDRLLIKMLILDDVPQKNLACSLGIDSGNVTRRRQRIVKEIWNRVLEATSGTTSTRTVRDCLELILAGEDVELRQRMSSILASGFDEADGELSGQSDP